MELRYSKNSRLLFLAMLGATFATLAYLIFMYNPLEAITAKVISMYPGSIAFGIWKEPPYDVSVKLYIFNVNNSEEFLRGEEKLRFHEVGPYVYKEELLHLNATFNENGSLTFLPRRLLHFKREESVGDPSVDTILTPNVPLLGITAALQDYSMFVNLAVASASTYHGSKPFLNITIDEYLYGYDDPLVTLANTLVPNWIDFSRFGVLDRLMALDNGSNIVTLNTNPENKASISDGAGLLSIEKWNGSPGMKQWGYEDSDENQTNPKNTDCNTLRGAYLGTNFPPNLQRNVSIKLYRHSFCRPVPIEYHQDVVTEDGFQGYRYRGKKDFLATKEDNPDNYCYCKGDECLPSGIGDLSPCYYDIPIVMSQPHFLDVDAKVQKLVDGLSPDEEKHESFMVIHPQIGLPLKIRSRLQVNLKMPETKYNAKTKPFNNLIIPLFWVELCVDNVPSQLKLFIRLLYHILPVAQQVLMYCFALLGLGLIFGSALATVRHFLYFRHKDHYRLNVDYSEIPVFPLKTKVLRPHILISK